LARLFERQLRFAPFGQVAGDLGKADMVAGRVADGVDDDMGPEGLPLLADPPALTLEAVLAAGNFEIALGVAFGLGFGGIETGEVGAEDLAGGIALEALGARV